jgi:uncharacterized protein
MERLEQVRTLVDEILEKQEDVKMRRAGYVHLYGVSLCATALAMHRGLDIERCAVIGLLHDISTYQTGSSRNHEKKSADAAEVLLSAIKGFSLEEIGCISEAIALHRKKRETHGEYAEMIKDADALQHYLYGPGDVSSKEKRRLTELAEEISMPLKAPL